MERRRRQRSSRLFFALALSLSAAACDDDAGRTNTEDATTTAEDMTAQDDATVDAVEDVEEGPVLRCGEKPPADYARKLVVSRPYTEDINVQGVAYEVFDVAMDGTISRPGVTFEMGRSNFTHVRFSMDGRVGLVAQDDGTVGVFRFEDDGSVTVVDAGFTGEFYASGVVVDPNAMRAWILDGNFRNNGGGVFAVDIACDGTLSAPEKRFESKLAAFGELTDGGALLLTAKDAIEEAVGPELHLIDVSGPSKLATADVFGADDEAIFSAMERTANGRHVLIADNNAFGGYPHRIGVAEVSGDTLTAVQELSPFNDPSDIIASPFDDVAIVLAFEDDAIVRLTYAPDAAEPFVVVGELAYTGGNPQLPSTAGMITSGALTGRVFVSENTAIRQLQFSGSGAVDDLGIFEMGGGSLNINGAIGVQP